MTASVIDFNGGTASFTAASNYTLIVDNLAIKSSGPSNGLLDLANSDLYLPGTAANFTALQQFWVNGYNLNSPDSQAPELLGDWSGVNGVTSSAARDSYSPTGNLKTTLGVYDGSFGDANGVAMGRGADEVNNLSPSLPANRILVRATATGDLNGNGVVNQYDTLIFNTFGNYLGGPNTNLLGTQAGDLNGDRQVDDTEILIFNTAGNYDAPTAVAPGVTAVPIAATAGVSFTGPVATFGSSTPGSTATDYSASINWGDGSSVDSTSGRDSAHAVKIAQNPTTGVFSVQGKHTYAASVGTPPAATVAVMHNPSMLRGTASVPVQIVAPIAPIVSANSLSLVQGQPYSGPIASFTASGPHTSPSDYTVSVNWGDGTELDTTSATVTPNALGSFTVGANHMYLVPGAYTFAVAVTLAPSGISGTDAATATVVAPSILPTLPTALVATVLSSHSVELDWAPSDNATGYKIFRSEAGGPFSLLDENSGNVNLYEDGTLSAHSSYAYRVQAENDLGLSGLSNVASAVTDDDAPKVVANGPANDVLPSPNQTHAGVPLEIDVLANASDSNGDSLSIGTLTDPGHGTVAITSGTKITYTPATGFVGRDTFTYTATDTMLESSPATVTIDVTNSLPNTYSESYAPNGPTWNDTSKVWSTTPITGNVSASDAESDTLTFKKVSGPTGGGKFNLNAITGEFTFTPAPDSTGSAKTSSVIVKVSDAIGDSNYASLTFIGYHIQTEAEEGESATALDGDEIVTQNPLPIASEQYPGSIFQTQTLRAAVLLPASSSITRIIHAASPSDDGDEPSLPAATSSATSSTGPYTAQQVTDDPGNPDAAGRTIALNSDGSYTYAPPAGFSGQDWFTYYITDSEGTKSNYATVFIDVIPVKAALSWDDLPRDQQDSTGEFLGLSTDSSTPKRVALHLDINPAAAGLPNGTQVTLKFTDSGQGDVSVWDGADSSATQLLGSGTIEKTWTVGTDDVLDTVYVEGDQVSGSSSDVTFDLTVQLPQADVQNRAAVTAATAPVATPEPIKARPAKAEIQAGDLFAFDGTWNVPQENTNVWRFQDLYNGNVNYSPGIGANEVNPKKANLIDGAIGLGGREILTRAFQKLTTDFNSLTTRQRDVFKLDIVGFSRGSALALAFSNMIWDGNGIPVGNHFEKPLIRFMGLFDTVASFNVGVLNFAGSPIAPLNLGWSLNRQFSTQYVAHASRDPDFRPCFQTINVDADAKKSYSLSHWGVGTSDDSMKWMLHRAQSQGVPVRRFFR